MLSVDCLTVGYGRVPVLLDVTLRVAAGELVAIIGSNGAGKSTLLRTVSGLLKPTGGTITFDGAAIEGTRPDRIVRAGIVHCPEGRRVFPRLSVRDNLRMGAHVRRDSEAERLEEAFDIFPILRERATQLAGRLSGGEQQMLAVGRALMADPTLVMLDEPSLGLSPILVDSVLEATARIRSLGKTVLLVEQNVDLALEIADRAYVIERGRVVLEGTGKDLASSEEVQQAFLGA